MELAVREQLLAAESGRDVQALKNAYELIKSANQGQSALDSSDNISTDLYVLCAEQALQRPTETAMLLSLTGVGSVIATQWYTTLQENAERLEVLFENLLSFGKTAGQTVRILQSRSHRKRDSIKMETDSHSSPGDKKEEQTVCTSSDLPATHPSFFNCVVCGLPNIILM